MNQEIFLKGYTTQATAYEVKDYPYGFRLRTSIFYWIESKEGKGDRLGTYTINPKTGRPNAPKYSTYSTFMYLFINEDGHVKHGTINSYDLEEFEARLPFILNKIGEAYLSDTQKQNIRVNHYLHLRASYPYVLAKYSEAMKSSYKTWMEVTLKHIKTCEFKNLVNYTEAPAQDNKEGEVKMIITQSQAAASC